MSEEAAWETRITKVEPDNLRIAGQALQELIGKRGLLEVAHLLVTGKLPESDGLARLENIAIRGARLPPPQTAWDRREDVSKATARCLLMDSEIIKFDGGGIELTAFTLGRTAVYIAWLFDNIPELSTLDESEPFIKYIWTALTGAKFDELKSNLLEAMMVASVDHGVTPPSAQATRIAATARASYEVSIAHGVGAITDVHGGAGSAAAEFFGECVKNANGNLEGAIEKQIKDYIADGKRIKGLGHRLHKQDPRRDAIWALAEKTGIAGEHIRASKLVSSIFESVNGKILPVNVDGVIGAVVADMGFEPVMAKVIFIYGRIAGLSAHYFEELAMQKPMRRIDFSKAVYTGL